MMEEMQLFENKEFANVRIIINNDEPWFVGKDVCECFGDTNYRRSLSNIDDCDKGVTKVTTSGGDQKMVIVNESGLYSLLFQMQPQKSKGVSQNDPPFVERVEKLHRFKRWVTSEVLPSIRKTGSYQKPMTVQEQIQLLAQGNMELEKKMDSIDKDLQNFKKDLPLLAIEIEKITKTVKKKAVDLLGGKNSEAYADKSIRSKVFSDIYAEVKRQFGLGNSFKELKRCQVSDAINMIFNNYELPMCIRSEVEIANAQMTITD